MSSPRIDLFHSIPEELHGQHNRSGLLVTSPNPPKNQRRGLLLQVSSWFALALLSSVTTATSPRRRSIKAANVVATATAPNYPNPVRTPGHHLALTNPELFNHLSHGHSAYHPRCAPRCRAEISTILRGKDSSTHLCSHMLVLLYHMLLKALSILLM